MSRPAFSVQDAFTDPGTAFPIKKSPPAAQLLQGAGISARGSTLFIWLAVRNATALSITVPEIRLVNLSFSMMKNSGYTFHHIG